MERWLAAETDSHDADKVRMQQLEKEIRQLRKKKADLEDTVDILKKQRPSSVKAREKVRNNPQRSRGTFCGEDVPGFESLPKRVLPVADLSKKRCKARKSGNL